MVLLWFPRVEGHWGGCWFRVADMGFSLSVLFGQARHASCFSLFWVKDCRKQRNQRTNKYQRDTAQRVVHPSAGLLSNLACSVKSQDRRGGREGRGAEMCQVAQESKRARVNLLATSVASPVHFGKHHHAKGKLR